MPAPASPRFLGSVPVFFTISALVVACSGASAGPLLADAPPEPCCYAGFIHQCADDASLARCSDPTSSDAGGCVKTSKACGTASSAHPPSAASNETPPTPPPATGSAKKKTGATCSDASQCTGELCLVIGKGASGFCSEACAATSECPQNFSCEMSTSIGHKICAPKGEKRSGETCQTAIECVSTLCIGAEGKLGYCTASCASAADCLPGWACAPIASGSGSFCVRP